MRRIVLVVIITVCSGLLLESAARIFLWAKGQPFYGNFLYKPHRFLGYTLRPNTAINGPSSYSEQSKKFSINSLGFRGQNCTIRKPDNTYRIFCLGESSTFCVTSSDDEHTWPYLLEKLLTKEDPQDTIEVINAGVPGWTTYESMINLAIRILDYDPDMIIVYHGANDVAYCHRATETFNYSDKPPISPYSKLFDNSAAYILLMTGGKFGSNKAPKKKLPDTFKPYGPRAFRRNLQNIISIGKAHNVQVILSTQATLIQENPRGTDWEEVSAGNLAWFGLNQKALVRAYKEINSTIKELSTKNHVAFVDNGEKVPHTFEYLIDYAHLTDKGSEEVARNFFEAIKKEEFIRQKVSSKH